jgi:hypothetical protein
LNTRIENIFHTIRDLELRMGTQDMQWLKFQMTPK